MPCDKVLSVMTGMLLTLSGQIEGRKKKKDLRAHPVLNCAIPEMFAVSSSCPPQRRQPLVTVAFCSQTRPPWRIGGTSKRPTAQFVMYFFGLGVELVETTVMITRTKSDWNEESLVAAAGRVTVVVVRERVTVGLDRWNVCWCSKVRTPRVHEMGRVSLSLWKVVM